MTYPALTLAAAACALVALSGCNTIKGAGRDVSAGGAAVSKTASEVQSDIAANKAKQDAKDRAEGKGGPY
ncbi:MAG: hypothetical protein RL186_20 [Pseudomonadota bacterium]|jgi:predicted small secreted protein